MNEFLIVATVPCALAAYRLLMWRQLIAKDARWLDRKFGPKPDHREIATNYALVHVWLCAIVAAALAYKGATA